MNAPQSHKITSTRLAEIDAQLDTRDRAVIDDLQRLRIATGLQLQRLHHGTDPAAKQRRIRQMARLSRWRIVHRMPRRIGGIEGGRIGGSLSSVYTLDIAGQRLVEAHAGRPRSPWTPSSPFIRHGLAVSEVYVRLREAEARRELELLEFDTEPDCWRRFNDDGGQPVLLKPDAYVVVGHGEFEHHAFLEADLGSVSTTRLTEHAWRFLDYHHTDIEQRQRDVFPRVVWFTPTPGRVEQIAVAIRRLPEYFHELFSVTTDEKVITAITGADEGARL